MEVQTQPKPRRGRPTNAERAAKAAAHAAGVSVPPPPAATVVAAGLAAATAALAPEPLAPMPPLPPVVPDRPELREPMRELSPREEAERIAAEWFGHLDTLGPQKDKYYVDPARIPDSWTYEWRTFTVVGKENPQYQVELARSAWRPVPAKRHPELMPSGHLGETILIDGMMLMERPRAITDYQRAKDQKDARAPVENIRAKLSGAPAGTFERGTHPGAPVAVKTEWAPPPVAAKA